MKSRFLGWRALTLAPVLVCGLGINSCSSSSQGYNHRSIQRQIVLVDSSLGTSDSIAEQIDPQSAYIASDNDLVLWVHTANYEIRAIFRGLPGPGATLQTKNIWVLHQGKPTDTTESGNMKEGIGQVTGIPFSIPDSQVEAELKDVSYTGIAWKKGLSFSISWPHRKVTGESHMIRMTVHQPDIAN